MDTNDSAPQSSSSHPSHQHISHTQKEQALHVDPTAPITKLRTSANFLKIRTPARILFAGPTLSGAQRSTDFIYLVCQFSESKCNK